MSSFFPQKHRSSCKVVCALGVAHPARFICSLILVAFLWATASVAQTSRDDARPRRNPDEPQVSAARRAADAAVALSPEIIIDTLRREPGLLLLVKKVLVEKAYEQGRLLDSEDLTDDVLFHLIRDDQKIRILATREMENRGYIRVKPTLEEQKEQRELERRWRQLEGAQGREPAQPQQGTDQRRTLKTGQEDDYYARHEPLPYVPPSQARPRQQSPDQQPAPDYDQSQQQRRQNRASLNAEPPADTDVPQMARVRPDDLSGILPEQSVDVPTLAADRGRLSPRSEQSDVPAGSLPSAGSYGSQVEESSRPRTSELAALNRRAYGPLMPEREPRYEQPPIRRRPNPYADVPSLYDIYAQVARRSPVLDRFGSDIFVNGTGNTDELPMDLPAGPDYVLGPGDGLTINLWGGISQRLQRTVDREGRVALPEVGAVFVAGRNLGDVQHQIQTVLRTQFRDVQADVSLGRLRTVRVYVVGDVHRPGAYDVSSLSTPLNALYAAGGPTSRGSLRTLKHYRGKELVQDVDVYDLILHGVRSDMRGLQPGDTILVPPIGPQVTIEGMVRRPAIYELHGPGASLAEALELAGGVLSTGTLRHVAVERVLAHQQRTMLDLDIPETNNQEAVTAALENFKIQDGDKIRISPILPYSQKTVYLDGHVFHPGKYPWTDGMKLTDLVKSYSDLLPEPSKRHAEIIRLNPPDFTPTVLNFNLADALSGKGDVPVLKPFDTVRVFGRYDFEDPPQITVSGEVRDPGDRLTNGVTHVRDAVYLAGGVTSDAKLDDAEILRKDGNTLQVISVNLAKALAGDEVQNVLLQPKDRLIINLDLAKLDPPRVTIEGEVAKPGKYPLGDNMTAADLVRIAGGLKRGAYSRSADLTRYILQNGAKVIGEHEEVAIGKALSGDADTDMRLRDGDVLTIRQLAGWSDVGAIIAVKGEVVHPGSYGIQDGEHLSSILERAGGFRAGAYPYGAILLRGQVRELEEKNQSEIIRRVEGQKGSLMLIQDTDPQQKQAKEAVLQQWEITLEKLRDNPPQGRLVVHIASDIAHWKNTASDVEVRAGDVLMIPKRPNYVTVVGQVFNPTALTFRPGKSARWYLGQAGGPTTLANKKAIFVIRADGSVVGSSSGGFWQGNPLSVALQPGDTVVVPERAIGGPRNWQGIMQTAQVLSSIAVTSAVVVSNF
ncbi:MAG: SLBB domain-containing protein [Terriglobales bacterium]